MINMRIRIWKLIKIFPNVETNAASVVLKETAITYLKKNLILKTVFNSLL